MPDPSLIDTIWAYLKQKMAEFSPKNRAELKARILEKWNSILVEYCQKLSMC